MSQIHGLEITLKMFSVNLLNLLTPMPLENYFSMLPMKLENMKKIENQENNDFSEI